MFTTGTRKPSTSRQGNRFDETAIQAVWNKAQIILGADPNYRRKDRCGAIIERSKYGETIHHGTGWEIDHIVPVANGGGDDLSNLQPLQWENNRRKGDAYPAANYCAVTAAR